MNPQGNPKAASRFHIGPKVARYGSESGMAGRPEVLQSPGLPGQLLGWSARPKNRPSLLADSLSSGVLNLNDCLKALRDAGLEHAP
jgi:hypothetical protein